MTNVDIAIQKIGCDKSTFAKLIGVSRVTLHKWCRTGEVSDAHLEAFCRMTQVDATMVSSKASRILALSKKRERRYDVS